MYCVFFLSTAFLLFAVVLCNNVSMRMICFFAAVFYQL